MTAGAAPAALVHIESDVRELLVRRELPLDEDRALHALVDEVVADYRDRYLDGGLPPLADREVDLLRQRILGFGALTPLIEDPSVEEIWVNEPGRVFIARNGEHELTGVVLEARDVEEIVERMLARAGRRLDRAQPFVDARLPDGSRLHVTIPPITNHWSVNVRKFVGLRAHSCAELVELGSCSATAARFLDASVQAGLSVVVAGAVGAGKTTLLNCLLAAVPARERIVTCEEVFELRVDRPDVVAMQCRQANLEGEGAVTLRTLVRESLRMRPDRIVVGEVRGAEVKELLTSLNTGHEGGAGTLHANSPAEVPARLEALGALAGLDPQALHSQVTAAVQLVLHMRRADDGQRHLTEIGRFTRTAGGLEVHPIWTREHGWHQKEALC